MTGRIRIQIEIRILTIFGLDRFAVLFVYKAGHVGKILPAFQLFQQPRHSVISGVETAKINFRGHYRFGRINPQVIPPHHHFHIAQAATEIADPIKRLAKHVGGHHETEDVRLILFQPVKNLLWGQLQSTGIDKNDLVPRLLRNGRHPGQRQRWKQPEITLYDPQILFVQFVRKRIKNQSYFHSSLVKPGNPQYNLPLTDNFEPVNIKTQQEQQIWIKRRRTSPSVIGHTAIPVLLTIVGFKAQYLK